MARNYDYPPVTPKTYKISLLANTEFEFVSAHTIFPYEIRGAVSGAINRFTQIVYLNGEEVFRNVYSMNLSITTVGDYTKGENIGYNRKLSNGETYRVVYSYYSLDDALTNPTSFTNTVSYTFSVVENKLPLKKWTITDVINRLLDIAEPIRKGEKPRFRLQGMKADGTFEKGSQAELFDKTLAPEFSFTKQTLRECLQEVGKVIHGEPRLEPKKDENGYYYEVSYDMYASQEKSGIYHRKYAEKTVKQLVDSYTGWVDSNAENLINQLDKYGGGIIEPYRGGAKTVRTENLYVRITADNMIIPTQYPIYTVDKLEYVYNDNGEIKAVDITPWLFERTVYDTQLSTYAEQYPYSKAYGLYYAQGEKNIGGLNFKVDAAALEVYKDCAIVNILRQAMGNSKLEINDYPAMCFRVTYTPFYNVRVGQTKVNYKDFPRPAALIYNQAANVIESRYYGENLKGAIARTGNIDVSLTFRLYRISQIPKAGQMFNEDYYISAVAVEYMSNCIICTLGLSKDFNRLSAYIGIDASKRYSEVSQTQAVERNTLWREFVVVGDKETPDADCLIGDEMMAAIAGVFEQNAAEFLFQNGYSIEINDYMENLELGKQYRVVMGDKEYVGEVITVNGNYLIQLNESVTGYGLVYGYGKAYYPISNVCAWGTTYNGNDLAGIVNLPVISSAFGNSISFAWQYADNYSAGAISQYKDKAFNGGVGGYFQNDLAYVDYYGRLYYYNFDLQYAGEQPTWLNLWLLGQNLPKGTKPEQSSGYVSTVGQTPYILRKDNREALQCNFQIDFVTNTDIIIGSALASYCPAVRGQDGSLTARLYVFPTELNKFTDHVETWENVDLSKMPSFGVEVTRNGGYFTVKALRFPDSGKSWAIVTGQQSKTETVEDEQGKETPQITFYGGDLLIGRNQEVTAGQAFTPIYFTKKREIFDRTVWKDRW